MDIERIVDILKKGGICLIPNDTVYGLICDALNISAVNKIYELKNRDYSKPMLVLVSNYDMLYKCCSSINEIENDLINKYLPGELTIIFNKSNYIPNIVSSNKDTIGIRIPNNNDLIEIINKLGNPIVSTSANISSKENIINLSYLENKLKENVDYIYDGGTINNKPSCIVKVDNNKVVILREGNLSNEIRKEY